MFVAISLAGIIYPNYLGRACASRVMIGVGVHLYVCMALYHLFK